MSLRLHMPAVMLDLNSASATDTANIIFSPATDASRATLVKFGCDDCAEVCRTVRQWLLNNADDDDNGRLIRLENQDLDLLAGGTPGTLVLLDGAATLDGHTDRPITILALFTVGDSRVRFFWSLLSTTPLLVTLSAAAAISLPKEVHKTQDEHPQQVTGKRFTLKRERSYGMGIVGGAVLGAQAGRLGAAMLLETRNIDERANRRKSFYIFLTESFLHVTSLPHSADYTAALKIIDLCPPVQDPETSCSRIEGDSYLAFSGDSGRNLSDDRYLHEVEPAERELISVVEMTCAAYIRFKRQYLKDFAKDVLREGDKVLQLSRRYGNELPSSDAAPGTVTDTATDGASDRIDTPASETTGTKVPADKYSAAYAAWAKAARIKASRTAARNQETRVRTVHKHIRTIEADLGCTFTKARKLFTGWTLFGFLDESRILKMIQDGNMGEEQETIEISDDEMDAAHETEY